MSTTKHIAGNFIDGKQECIMCGEILCDYTNAMMPHGSPAPRGWAVGEIFISSGNPIIFSTMAPEGVKILPCCAELTP